MPGDLDVLSYPWPLAEPLWRYGVESHQDVLVEPTEEPVLLEEAKRHLRVTSIADDDYIKDLIVVAREECEFITRRALIDQALGLVMDRFPRGSGGGWGLSGVGLGVGWNAIIRIPRPPVVSVQSITYLDTDGNNQTLDPTLYQTDLPRGPHAKYGRIRPMPGQVWPEVQRGRLDAVLVTTINGYTSNASPATSPQQHKVPRALVRGMLLIIGELYKTRSESVNAVNTPAIIRARNLFSRYRVY